MKFSSPYNKEDRLSEKDEFYAITQDGDIYHVYEHYEGDKRFKNKRRLVRYAIIDGTPMNLMDTALAILPDSFTPNDPIKFLMLQVMFMRDTITSLNDDVATLQRDMELAERQLGAIDNEYFNS